MRLLVAVDCSDRPWQPWLMDFQVRSDFGRDKMGRFGWPFFQFLFDAAVTSRRSILKKQQHHRRQGAQRQLFGRIKPSYPNQTFECSIKKETIRDRMYIVHYLTMFYQQTSTYPFITYLRVISWNHLVSRLNSLPTPPSCKAHQSKSWAGATLVYSHVTAGAPAYFPAKLRPAVAIRVLTDDFPQHVVETEHPAVDLPKRLFNLMSKRLPICHTFINNKLNKWWTDIEKLI